MAVFLKKSLLTGIFLVAALWVVRYGWLEQKVETEQYSFGEDGIHHPWHSPKANYDFGLHAWRSDDLGLATNFFRRAITHNPLYMDAWLKLAQIAVEQEDLNHAKDLLQFAHGLTENRVKWKWPQIVLALQLGQTDIFLKNTNFVLSYSQLSQDALNLLDLAYGKKTESVTNVLDQANLPVYLKWLIREKRADDAVMVWDAMAPAQRSDKEQAANFIHFLVGQKYITKAAKIQEEILNSTGITNPGFEALPSNKGFDWRQYGSRENLWQIQRLPGNAADGDYALRITFSGNQNIRFHHVRQIIPVQPLHQYTLSWWWKSEGMTTDQRPYLEVRGFDGRFDAVQSPMVGTDADWEKMSIDFSVPEDCSAVQLRVCRDQSRRFDSKIKGRLWLDNFQLIVNE